MTQQIAISVTRSQEIMAYALVDDADYPRVAGSRWQMQGTAAPRYVYRLLDAAERAATGRTDRSLAREILRQPGRVTFCNGNPLDCRRANLLGPHERQRQQARAAQALQAAPLASPQAAGEAAASAAIPLTQGWTAWVDACRGERLGGYRWRATIRGAHVYVRRSSRRADGPLPPIYLARVLAGLQDLEKGGRLRPGVVTLDTPPDVATRCLDLRATNLLVTTRGGVNLRRPSRLHWRGVHRQEQRYRAHLKLCGQERVLGRYATPEAAAQARAAALQRLGLAELIRQPVAPTSHEAPHGAERGNAQRARPHASSFTPSR